METIVNTTIKSIEQIPGFTNIAGFSSFIGYQETESSKIFQSNIKKATVFKTRCWWGVSFLPLLFFALFYLTSGQLFYGFILGLTVLLLSLIFTRFAVLHEKQIYKDFYNDRRFYGLNIAAFTSSLFNAEYHYFSNGELFLFSAEFCSLIWIENGNMVTYQKKNIKNVELERFEENKQFQLRLEIYSNLPEYLNISLIFKENEQAVAGRIQTLLMA